MAVAQPWPPVRSSLRRRSLIATTLIGCTFCRTALRALAEEAQAHTGGQAAAHWTYHGESGPARWGELSPAFKVCELGLEQSPIELNDAIAADPESVDIAWQPMKLRIVNNGHTIQVNATPGSFALECHFVHRATSGGLAVLGVFIATGEANQALQPIWSAMPRREGPERDVGATVDPAALLPVDRSFFRYMGSLTTPPCSQGIVWTVLQQPIEASPEQIAQFAGLYANNARPVQSQSHRLLLRSG
jgi:carbonic anhydrase